MQFHQKFNPNLVNDDDQELSVQLRRRRLRSRRLTMTAMSPTISQHSSHSDISDENVTLRPKIKRQLSTDPSAGVEFFKQRAKQRRATMTTNRAKTIDHGAKGYLQEKVGGDFPGLDPSNRPHSTGDLEMRHVKPLGTIVEVENGGVAIGGTEDRRPFSDPNVQIGLPEERKPLMKTEKPATPPKPSPKPPKPPSAPKRKGKLKKSGRVDDDEDDFESQV